MIPRILGHEIAQSKKSILLLGPRQVGKSTLIKSLNPDLEINLADELEFLKYASRPEAFKELIENTDARSIYVDEIQRIPKLLNTIQFLIDRNKELKFFLTGSSARKLRRNDANLLPGRLINFKLGSLIARELNYQLDTKKSLEYGTLPEIYLEESQKINMQLLRSYSASYLKEEIKAESMVRNLDSFARFFGEVVLHVAEFVDYSKLAIRSKISRHAIPRYFEILEDTLIGYRVSHYGDVPDGIDLIKHPKFYFFDNGVYNGLIGNFAASLDRIGKLAEQLVYSQLLHSAWALDKDIKISSFRTRSGLEVDFIVEIDQQIFAVEVKNNQDIISDDLAGLNFFNDTIKAPKKLFLLHMGTSEKKFKEVWSLPWQKGLKAMGF